MKSDIEYESDIEYLPSSYGLHPWVTNYLSTLNRLFTLIIKTQVYFEQLNFSFNCHCSREAPFFFVTVLHLHVHIHKQHCSFNRPGVRIVYQISWDFLYINAANMCAVVNSRKRWDCKGLHAAMFEITFSRAVWEDYRRQKEPWWRSRAWENQDII